MPGPSGRPLWLGFPVLAKLTQQALVVLAIALSSSVVLAPLLTQTLRSSHSIGEYAVLALRVLQERG